MAEFMVLILENEAEQERLAPSETKALVEGHSAYERALRAAEAYLDGERLRPAAEARRVSARDGTVRVEIGPFEEAHLAGYYLVRAETLEAAIELAKKCPMTPGTSLEVRPVMSSHIKPEKRSQRGRVFAFAVLGSAANEKAWVEVMDEIDARTRDHVLGDGFLGGARLQAPGRGRSVASSRAVFDGPFLESKEVIGGVCFARMSTLEEAVQWASESEFVKLGALEIRELWRS